MGNMFGNLTTEGLQEVGDRLGGSSALESGLYDGVVKLAYATKSRSSNAQGIVVSIDVGGREVRETFWVTNKNGENFSVDKKDPKLKTPLPGFTSMEELCLVTTGLGLAETTIEEKVVNIYDFEAKKELPQNVPVLMDVIGKPVSIGVVRQTVDKTAKDSAGEYKPTGETRDENVIDKFFHQESHRTVTEIRQQIAEPIFYEKWGVKNTGVTRNRAKGADGAKTGAPGRPGAPAAAGAAGGAKARPSLFAAG